MLPWNGDALDIWSISRFKPIDGGSTLLKLGQVAVQNAGPNCVATACGQQCNSDSKVVVFSSCSSSTLRRSGDYRFSLLPCLGCSHDSSWTWRPQKRRRSRLFDQDCVCLGQQTTPARLHPGSSCACWPCGPSFRRCAVAAKRMMLLIRLFLCRPKAEEIWQIWQISFL